MKKYKLVQHGDAWPCLHCGKKTWSNPQRAMSHLVSELNKLQAPTKQGTRKVPTSVKNGFENAASSDYGILDSNQPNHAITYGLVCPDCLVEHCRHCKCEKCSKQGKKALANQANGKVNTVKTWKELGEVMKGKKVKEIEKMGWCSGELMFMKKINELIDAVNYLLKNK